MRKTKRNHGVQSRRDATYRKGQLVVRFLRKRGAAPITIGAGHSSGVATVTTRVRRRRNKSGKSRAWPTPKKASSLSPPNVGRGWSPKRWFKYLRRLP